MPQHNYTMPKKPMAAPGSTVLKGGDPVIVVTGPIRGGYIQNPSGGGQGVNAPEALYIDIVNTPGSRPQDLHRNTTFELSPGEWFTIPPLQPGVQVKANAETSGHLFTAVVW
jgi:hypothetical protein